MPPGRRPPLLLLARTPLLFAALALVSASGCYTRHGDGAIDGFVPLADAGPEPLDGGPPERCGAEQCAPTEVCCECGDESRCGDARIGCPPCGVGCASSADCSFGQVCELPAEMCSGIGRCIPRPQGCPADCPGVCGCNGREYCNACAALAAGTSILREGSCPDGRECRSVFDCFPSEYCDFGERGCFAMDARGTCQESPSCSSTGPPVCGCDGRLYEDTCRARSRGVDVDATLTCELEAFRRACENLCARSPGCGGPPTSECDPVCQEIVSACSPEQRLALYACSRMTDCDAIQECVDATGCR